MNEVKSIRMMKKGIVMCSYMNRALLAKRKFRTMRAGSLKILSREADSWEVDCKVSDAVYMRIVGRPDIASRRFSSQYEVGDRLYVKETFRYANFMLGCGGCACGVEYKADGKIYFNKKASKFAGKKENKDKKGQHAKWRPSIFMPKWATRIFMTVTKVTVQRPQELMPEECEVEGITGKTLSTPVRGQPYGIYSCDNGLNYSTPIEAFEALWNSLHGEGSYDRNEWCFVYYWKNIEIKGD